MSDQQHVFLLSILIRTPSQSAGRKLAGAIAAAAEVIYDGSAAWSVCDSPAGKFAAAGVRIECNLTKGEELKP
jgi:hypothetical protein